MVLAGLKELPSEKVLESLFRRQLESCEQLTQMLALYNQDVTMNEKPKSYERLLAMVKVHLANNRLRNNRDALASRNTRG